MVISVDISDLENGINRQNFTGIHQLDRRMGFTWIDRDGSDGWQVIFDPTGQPEARMLR
jgi:hypothetical protein